MKKICSLLIIALLSATPALAAQDDALLEKINRLEQQIQELKKLKEQQLIGAAKQEQCQKAVGQEKFCACLGGNLPREVSFEQYIHTVVTPKDALGYAAMTTEQRKDIDGTLSVRGKCAD